MGLKASAGAVEFDGRFRITVPLVVAFGALCAVSRFRSVVVPVLNSPLPVGGYTCSAWPFAFTTLPFLSCADFAVAHVHARRSRP